MSLLDYLYLFDGKTLNGWKMAGKGSFAILQNENVLQTEGGMGLLWYYKRKFKDFILELEWKASSKEFAAPSKINSRPTGEWNSLHIMARKQKYSVIANGVIVISSFTGNKSLEGYIGLQNHDDNSKVSFRNIKAKELFQTKS